MKNELNRELKYVISPISNELLNERAQSALKYLMPNYKTEMNYKQYTNAMNALKSIGEFNEDKLFFATIDSYKEQIKTLNEHGHKPIAVLTMLCEDTFVFETEKEATLAHEEMENTKDQKLQGWWYGKEDFYKAVVDYTQEHKTRVKIHWL